MVDRDFEHSFYMSLIPEYLRDNEDFLVFFKLLIHEFDISFENIRKFTDLVDPDKVPMQFIENLGAWMNYHYIPNASDDFNREVLTRVRNLYENRGTERSVLMAADHGDNPAWVGGDIFVPNYDIDEEVASLIVSNEIIFRHSKSKFSGTNVYQHGNKYGPGIVILSLPYVDSEIRKAINRELPAGVKYWFWLNGDFIPSDGADIDDYGNLTFRKSFRLYPWSDYERSIENYNSDTDFDYIINVTLDDDTPRTFIHNKSVFSGEKLFSGRDFTREDNTLEHELSVSMLDTSTLRLRFLDYRLEDGKSIYVPRVGTKYIVNDFGEILDLQNKKNIDNLNRPIDIDDVAVKEDLKVERRGIFTHSSRTLGIHDSYTKFSGLDMHTIDGMAEVIDITPYDVLYDAIEVENLKPDDYRSEFSQYGFDLDIEGSTVNKPVIYSWDFTRSLTDTIQGVTATLHTGEAWEIPGKSAGTVAPIRDSSGVVFNNAQQLVRLLGSDVDTTQLLRDKSIRVGVTSFDLDSSVPSTAGIVNVRFLMVGNHQVSNNIETSSIVYETGLNYAYMYTASSAASAYGWAFTTRAVRNGASGTVNERYKSDGDSPSLISGHTIGVYIDNDGYWSMYIDNNLYGVSVNHVDYNIFGLQIGAGGRVRYGGGFYNAVIRNVRIYEGNIFS